ncbi:hypothetical protein BCR41DRAFT_238256 [Lobosporangium transversale]|uniref:Uncharacterized protein n=1 Tax=Lobosporangium transversale TaxID=64571 RepID=A0A1Y2GXI6_9FUNG|nr:hypothetical protein BCR41DRAFT_238256 [Lobosporangium transversale]ORZ24977.1 hypothetical protein BCR41DRAFT_238256 [Lobosporangium transversale]|eukprot:XP_021883958.1 hypothetical protein BCR41DRAFT_238256 [Lobosporangium transversale]
MLSHCPPKKISSRAALFAWLCMESKTLVGHIYIPPFLYSLLSVIANDTNIRHFYFILFYFIFLNGYYCLHSDHLIRIVYRLKGEKKEKTATTTTMCFVGVMFVLIIFSTH